MPELPEIALTKEYVESTSLRKKIVKVDFPSESLLQAPKADFEKALKGSSISEVKRLGKYLFLQCDKAKWLVFHFGMTGKLEYYGNQESPEYSHLILSFEDDYSLAFICRRKLGKIYLTESVEKFQEEHDLGKDAFEFSSKEFQELLSRKKGSIKAVLTDQHEISGIGNVYSDEMLFQARIHPKTKTEKLTQKEIGELYNQMESVLRLAIKIGGKRSEFPKSYLIDHRKDGEDCPDCEGKIEKISVSGRSTYFCPSCQHLKK